MHSPQVRIRRDAKSDMLCAEILVRGKGGVAQIRAVAPLKPIRAALQRLVEQRTGTTVSGDSALGCKCQKAAMKLAGLNLMRTIKQASVAPQSLMREGHATKQARVAKLVSMAESGQLEEYGGWDGVVETIQNKRQAQLRAMVARGISEEVATNVVEKLLAEDEEIVTTAMHIVGDDEEEDEDEDDNEDEDEPDVETSGWNPFKRRKKRAPTVARRKPRQPHKAAKEASEDGGGGGGGGEEKEPEKDEESESEDSEPQDAAQAQR